jgi:hypothetical protein
MPNHPYATPAEVRAQSDALNTTMPDAELNILLDAISEAIDGYCNRPDGFVADSAATAREYEGSGRGWQRIDENVEISEVAVKDSVTDTTYTVWEASDWIAFSGDPLHPNFNKTPYTQIMIAPAGSYSHFTSGRYNTLTGFRPVYDAYHERRQRYAVPTVRVKAKWGYAVTVPSRVKQATIIEATRLFKRGEAAWADAIGNDVTGETRYIKGLDPVTQMILDKSRLVKPAIGMR